MSLNTSKNLGQIAAVIFSPTAPTNVNLIWWDTSSGPPYTAKFWNGTIWVSSTLLTNAFINGGNSFGGTTSLGTLDNHDVDLIRNNIRIASLKDSQLQVPKSILLGDGTGVIKDVIYMLNMLLTAEYVLKC